MKLSTCLLVALSFVTGAYSEDLLMVDTLQGEEYVQAIASGFTVKVVTETEFNAITTAEFSAFKAIVIGDPYCGSIDNLAFLDTNKDVWSSSVTGNIVLLGTDPSFHARGGIAGARNLITNSIGFAAGQTGATGLYMALSCSGELAPVSVLSYFGIFHTGASSADDTHIVASSPALGTLADSDISFWSFSVHETFTAYPTSGSNPFLPLAIVRNEVGAGSMSFADGSTGVPYILARGATPAGCGDGIWQPTLGEQCDKGILNGQDGGDCSVACRCVSGLPDGAGNCLAPPSSSMSAASSTEASSTEASSTEASSTEASSAEASSTEASSTEASSTEASTTEASSTEASSMESSSTESSSTEASTTEASSTEMSSTESSNTEASSTEASSMESSSTEAPRTTSSIAGSLSSTGFETPSTSTLNMVYSSLSSGSVPSGRPSPSEISTMSSLNPSIMSTLNSQALSTSTATSSIAGTDSLATSSPPSTTAASGPRSLSGSSTASTTAAIPFTPFTFIIQIIFTTRNKRQLATSFVVLNSAGNVVSTPSCLQSSLFTISTGGRLLSNSLIARALPARIPTGSEPFTFALPVTGQVDTTFLNSGGQIAWNNPAFVNGNAIFAINPTSQLVEVFYAGVPPPSYQTIAFRIIPAATVADACLAFAGGPTPGSITPATSAGTAPVPTPTPNDKPVGLEKVVYVTIRTTIIGGATICLTDPGYTSTKYIYRSAVPGSPCYACLFAAENIECPNDDERKYTVITSSCTQPNSALFTAPSAVYIPCATCTATTLRGTAVTPGAAPPPPGFVPVKTATIGGGEVILGSVSVGGYAVSTAFAVPKNAPQVGVDLPAEPPKPNKPADAIPVGGDIPGNANPKVEAAPPQGTYVNANTKAAETPVGANPTTNPVLTGSAASIMKGLTFLHFALLALLI